MATIIDVAREADVSVATVSRVLNKSFRVSDEKQQRVMAAMEKVGYVPQDRPQHRKQNASKIILCLTSIFFTDFFDGMVETAGNLGYEILFSYITDRENESQSMGHLFKLFQQDQVSGVVTLNYVHRSDELRKILQPYPLVQVGEPLDMKDFGENYLVSIDDRQAAYDMAAHLIKQGKRNIALLTINNVLSRSAESFVTEREAGFYKALDEYGILHDMRFVSDFTTEDSSNITRKILKQQNWPDAIFCISDTMAYGCLRALREADVRVPEDVAVCGFDNMDFSDCMAPPLTTIDQSLEEMGASAIRMLHEVITGEIKTGRKLYIKHRLIERASTLSKNK